MPALQGIDWTCDSAIHMSRYGCDITTSWPISGKFTPEQAAIYNGVLRAQELVKAAMKPGVAWMVSCRSFILPAQKLVEAWPVSCSSLGLPAMKPGVAWPVACSSLWLPASSQIPSSPFPHLCSLSPLPVLHSLPLCSPPSPFLDCFLTNHLHIAGINSPSTHVTAANAAVGAYLYVGNA